jgi:hypothetical protein
MSSCNKDGFAARLRSAVSACGRLLPATGALVLTVGALSVTSASAQPTGATWTGTGATGDWSLPDNWLGHSVPGASIGTLTLPDLGTSCDDVNNPPAWETCYAATDDLGTTNVGQIVLDNAGPWNIGAAGPSDQIQLSGEPTDVGGTTENVGLSATLNPDEGEPHISVPITLTANQHWKIDGVSDSDDSSAIAVDNVSGPVYALDVDLSHGAQLTTGSVTTEALTVNGDGVLSVGGSGASRPELPGPGTTLSGGAGLAINAAGTASGPLAVATGSQSTISIGNPTEAPTTATLNVTSDVSLTAATTLQLSIAQPATGGGSESVPGTDYSQITAGSDIELSNAKLDAVLSVAANGGCDDLVTGQTYTLVSASSVSGVLDDSNGTPIADGATVSLDNQCNDAAAPTVTINYTSTSVIATVHSAGHAGDVPTFEGGGSSSFPSISGTHVVGSPLEASPGSDWTGNPTGFHYQWSSCAANAGPCTYVGTDSAQYTPTASDAGSTMEVLITPVNIYGTGYGTVVRDSAPITLPPPPTDSAPPTLSGTAQVGSSLTAAAGSWSSFPTFTYQWQRCTSSQATNCVNIGGATASSYTLTSADVSEYVRVAVTATGLGGPTVAYSATSAQIAGTTTPPPPTTTTTTTTTPAVTLPPGSQIRSSLSGITHPSGKKAITALLKSGSVRTKFKAPGAGSLSVSWTTTVTTGTGKHKKRKTVTVATGTAHAGGAGTVTFTVHLTGSGKTLLKKKPTGLSTTATEKFKPTGGRSWVSVTKKFSL